MSSKTICIGFVGCGVVGTGTLQIAVEQIVVRDPNVDIPVETMGRLEPADRRDAHPPGSRRSAR